LQLSLHADYAFRALLYLAARPDEVCSTESIARAYGISRYHLVRVVKTLESGGLITIQTGRGGGLRLRKAPSQMRLGEVLCAAEPNLNLLECFDPVTNTCPIIGVCRLQGYLRAALRAFVAELDRHTVADVMSGQLGKDLRHLLVQLGQPIPPD
jgi:Rrf2 family nitric oxide-sensitive transcriptional repressor